MEDEKLICNRCGVPLENRKALFEYMNRTYSHPVPVCPKCGKVYISRELAEGRMAEIETLLEDK
jgi:predicted RNA-binding Zn-ribbon protein involved in translation (DUF1610 family)